MSSLYLFQFAALVFMLVNALFVALARLNARWKNKPCAEASTVSPSGRSALSEERIALIQERIDSWCVQRGYKDYSINFMTLSRSLSISKADLAVYFSQRLHTTFRVWLSDIRFRAAQSMMLEHPHYSNDVISAECGFSSRTQLYRIFKAKEGCTPTAWRERQSQQDLLGR